MTESELSRLARANDVGLKQWFAETRGLDLAADVEQFRDAQVEALEWLARQDCPYLFVNAPTGTGKTLMLAGYGTMADVTWTYTVHTNALQDQVARTFTNLPTIRGRRNFECEVEPVTADQAECAFDRNCDCPFKTGDGEGGLGGYCGYYAQRLSAMAAPHRTANYAMFLRDASLRGLDRENRPVSRLILADEAHNIEAAVVNSVEVALNRRTCSRFGITLPEFPTMDKWVAWARSSSVPEIKKNSPGNFGAQTIRQAIFTLRKIEPSNEGNWLITPETWGVRFEPIWGAPFVTSRLFGHIGFEKGKLLNAMRGGVEKAVMTSATLMGAEYIADTLGLPEGSWAYLDLPSPFAVSNRPINFAPVETMNATKVGSYEGRTRMREAVDRLIEHYVLAGAPTGIIHAVSNKYRDFLLTESRWRGILTKDPEEHKERVTRGEASVVVAANLAEGWDGVDDLCRFVIMPKVPYPNLGDRRVSIRKEEDSRSFDHATLVAVVQGAGRGVRHASDTADTWILDGAWKYLYDKRKSWLPEAFTSAYHHNVQLP